MEKTLYRSRRSKKICGVCGGLAKYLNMDPTIMRLLAVLLTFCTGLGLGIIAYVVAALLMPEEPEDIVEEVPKQPEEPATEA